MKNKLFYISLAVFLSLTTNILYTKLFEHENAEILYSTNADGANNLTAELMTINKNILKNDPFFPHAMYGRNIPFCYRAFWTYVGYLGKILGNLELANSLITFTFSLIFISGVCGLCWYLTGNPYIGILVSVFSSIPMEATGGTIYGIISLFAPAVLNNMFNSLSPWLLLLFFKTYKSSNKFLFFFLSLAFLTNFYLLGASQLMLVIVIALVITNSKLLRRDGIFDFWKIILLAGIILIAILPAFVGFKDEFGISSQHIPMKWLRSRFAYIFYDYSLIVDKITFWGVPVVVGIFGYWLKKKSGERWENDDLIRALFYSVSIVTAFGIIANYNVSFIKFFIDMVSVYLYLIAFLYAAYAVNKLYKKGGFVYLSVSILITALLIVPKGEAFVPFLRRAEEIIIPSKKIPHLIERQQKETVSLDIQTRKALKASFLNMADWVKGNTNVNDIFIIPLEPQFPAFRYYAQRPIVTDWKSGHSILQDTGLGNRWILAYTLINDAYKKMDEMKFIYAAKCFNAKWLVVGRNSPHLNFPVVYQDEYFLIYKIKNMAPS